MFQSALLLINQSLSSAWRQLSKRGSAAIAARYRIRFMICVEVFKLVSFVRFIRSQLLMFQGGCSWRGTVERQATGRRVPAIGRSPYGWRKVSYSVPLKIRPGEGAHFGGGLQAEVVFDVLAMGIDGLGADAELPGDPGEGAPLRVEPEHGALAPAERCLPREPIRATGFADSFLQFSRRVT